ncbi:MAG: hypothetical protein JWN66_4730 [Sphingomonas bacterium]|uniref:hypothetical protein n=1 Tax=Sphingomonas bacterium TaxID=1895847 RepID=UPI0026184296|nr:hypothetical protein [Sphingomonas bacterium]MDB5707614.1 hypothetical protein [Sphingomonas bacterium]
MEFPGGPLNLFMTEIGEPEENTLRVVVTEGELGDLTSVDMAGTEISGARPIEMGPDSRKFEFYWDSYIAYVVRNESYWKKETGEAEFSSHFYSRTTSAFLDYVAATTFASEDYPGPMTHWALDTLNHCLAVVGIEAPRLRQLHGTGVAQSHLRLV